MQYKRQSNGNKKIVATEMYLSCMKGILETGKSLSIPITGGSMSPFLLQGRDRVQLAPVQRLPQKGDIALFQREDGQFILHRICRVESHKKYWFIGDAQMHREGPIYREKIVGIVCAAYRKGKWIQRGDFWWEFFAHAWLWVIPVRRKICSNYSRIRERSAGGRWNSYM